MPERRSMDINAPLSRGSMRAYNGRPLNGVRPHAVPAGVSRSPVPHTPKPVQAAPSPTFGQTPQTSPRVVQDFVTAPKRQPLPAPISSVPQSTTAVMQDFAVPVRRQSPPQHHVPAPGAPVQQYVAAHQSAQPHLTPRQVPVQVRHHQSTPVHTVSQPRQLKSQVLRRDAIKPVHAPPVQVGKVTLPRVKKPKVRNKALVALTVFSLIFGAGSGVFAWQTKFGSSEVQGVNELSKNDPDVQTGEHPSEVAPTLDQYKEYAVGTAFPRYVRIPAIGVNARVRQIGLGTDNKLQSPANVFDAGWYNRSAKPGTEGTMLVTAHVSGPNIAGVFANVHKLQPGNLIEIEQGNGKKTLYKVLLTKQVEEGAYELSQAMRPADPAKPGLNLVTTRPVFNPITNKYDPRVVVYAVQAN